MADFKEISDEMPLFCNGLSTEPSQEGTAIAGGYLLFIGVAQIHCPPGGCVTSPGNGMMWQICDASIMLTALALGWTCDEDRHREENGQRRHGGQRDQRGERVTGGKPVTMAEPGMARDR